MQFATQQEETETQTRHEADMYWMYCMYRTGYQLPVYHNGRIDFECIIGWHLHKIDDMYKWGVFAGKFCHW